MTRCVYCQVARISLIRCRLSAAVCGLAYSVVVIATGNMLVQPCQGQQAEEKKDVAQLLDELRDENVSKAASAAKELGSYESDPKAIVPWLIEALADERSVRPAVLDPHSSKTVATYAARSLAQLGPSGIPALEKVITEADDSRVRAYALSAIRQMGVQAEAAIPTLLKAMNHQDESTRERAMVTLSVVAREPGQFLEEFSEMLKDPEPAIRVHSLEILQKMGTAANPAVPQITSLLDDRAIQIVDLRAETVASVACQTLPDLGDEARVALPKLRQLIHDKDEYLRVDAALACARLSTQDTEALQVLIESAQSESRDFGLACHALKALAQLGSQAAPAEPVVERLLMHQDSLIRAAAAEAVSQIAPERAVHRLVPLCKDSDFIVRSKVIKLLGKCSPDDDQVFKMVVGALEDTDSLVRLASVAQLSHWGSQANRALPALKRCLQNEPVPSVREAIEEAIQKISQADVMQD